METDETNWLTWCVVLWPTSPPHNSTESRDYGRYKMFLIYDLYHLFISFANFSSDLFIFCSNFYQEIGICNLDPIQKYKIHFEVWNTSKIIKQQWISFPDLLVCLLGKFEMTTQLIFILQPCLSEEPDKSNQWKVTKVLFCSLIPIQTFWFGLRSWT